MRRCIGITKTVQRCKRSAERSRVPLCHQHRWQPVLLVLFVLLPLLADLGSLGAFVAAWMQNGAAQHHGDPQADDVQIGVTLLPAEEGDGTVATTDNSRPQIAYEVLDAEGPLVVRPRHPYLDQLRSGFVEGQLLDTSIFSDATWRFPVLDLRLLNAGQTPLSVGEIELEMRKIKPNEDPIILVGSYTGRSLTFLNEGWGPVRNPRLSYSVHLGSILTDEPFAEQVQSMTVHDFAFHTNLPEFGHRTEISIEDALPKVLAPRSGAEVAIVGKLTYETAGGDKRALLFRTRTWLSSTISANPLPLTATYDVLVDVLNPRHRYVVPLSHVVQAGEADSIGLRIAASRSATLEGRLTAKSFDGSSLVSRDFTVDVVVPRSLVRRCLFLPPFDVCKATEIGAPARPRLNNDHVRHREQLANDIAEPLNLLPKRGQATLVLPPEAVDNAAFFSSRTDHLEAPYGLRIDPFAPDANFILYSPDRHSEAVELQRRLMPYGFELRRDEGQDHLVVNFAEVVPRVLVVYTADHAEFAVKIAGELRERCIVTLAPVGSAPKGLANFTLHLNGADKLRDSWVAEFSKGYLLPVIFRDLGDPSFMGQFDALLLLATTE